MANIIWEFQVRGGAPVELPVVPKDGEVFPVILTGLTSVSRTFIVTNTLSRPVSFPSLTIEKEGPGSDKLKVSLLSNALVLAANSNTEVTVNLEANTEMSELDTCTVRVKGSEG